jgi:hypothetical protein
MTINRDDQYSLTSPFAKPTARQWLFNPRNFSNDTSSSNPTAVAAAVVNIVHSRAEVDVSNNIGSAPDSKRRTKITVVPNAVRRDVSLRAQAVRHSSTFKQRDDRLYVWIV